MFFAVKEAKLKVQNDSSHGNDSKKSSSVFKRKLFRFSNSFPEAQVSCSVYKYFAVAVASISY